MSTFGFSQNAPVESSVERIVLWLRRENPELFQDLANGANKKDFDQLSKTIGMDLPESFIALYSIHNGQKNNATGLVMTQEFLSIQEIIKQWQIWKTLYDEGQFENWNVKAENGIQNEWWVPGWVPLTHDGAGNHYMLDLSPGLLGTHAQVIQFWHDSPRRIYVAPSIEGWLETYADDLEKGKYIYDKRRKAITLSN